MRLKSVSKTNCDRSRLLFIVEWGMIFVSRMTHNAVFSQCRRYRYVLRRTWRDSLPAVLFVALNPSTADETTDDATVRRCVGFAADWGFGSVIMANLFAYRSTDPIALRNVSDPIGPQNDRWLKALSHEARLTVAAWGIHGSLYNRADIVLPALKNVHHLGRTKQGHPRHPLYLSKTTPLVQF